jgi:hypothetical protein
MLLFYLVASTLAPQKEIMSIRVFVTSGIFDKEYNEITGPLQDENIFLLYSSPDELTHDDR